MLVWNTDAFDTTEPFECYKEIKIKSLTKKYNTIKISKCK